MPTPQEQFLNVIANELKFITKHVNNLETRDFDELDEINMSINAAKDALEMLRLELAPACESIPAGVPYPQAA